MSQQSTTTNQSPVNVGKMWWFAEGQVAAGAMKAELLEKGVIDVELREPDESGRIDVIFSLDRDRAREILGFPVAEEEWLEAE